VNGNITGIALQSIEFFLKNQIIHLKTNGIKNLLDELIDSINKCQFEISDSNSDEQVLIKILRLFQTCIDSEIGILLEENKILDIIKSCFRIGRETRQTENLKNASDFVLIDIISTLYSRVSNYYIKSEMENVFEYICNLCDPEKEGKSASLRILGLQLSNLVLEEFGDKIVNFEKIKNLCCTKLSRSLLKVFKF
jgi:hypothetical protein